MVEETRTENEHVFKNSNLKNLVNAGANKLEPLIVSDYLIDAELDIKDRKLSVSQKIIWRNKTAHKTDQIFLHLYPNGYTNNSLLSKKGNIPIESRTRINISKLYVDDMNTEFNFLQPDISELHDSTVAKISLNKFITPGDSVIINIEYAIRVPKIIYGLGYFAGEEFYMFSQWFPQVGVFKNNEWHCSQMYSPIDFYSEYSNFNVNINVPSDYFAGASGSLIDSMKIGNRKKYSFQQKSIHDFAWFAAKEMDCYTETFLTKRNNKITIKAYVQPMRDWYVGRCINAVKNSLEYLEENFGVYEYGTLSIVDIPSINNDMGREFPTLLTYETDLLSPQDLNSPENEIINRVVHQYFYGMMSINQVYEAWIDEGICSFLTSKILNQYYGEENLSFKLATYFPVKGLNFLSYSEVPLVYTLGDYTFTQGTLALEKYYSNLKTGTVADTSFNHPTKLAYEVNTKNKPELILLTLEKYLGSEKVMEILEVFYNRFKFKHPVGQDILDVIQEYTSEDMIWFKENFYANAYYFDYGVSNIQKVSENEYSVLCRRYGDGVFPVQIALYTNQDTLYSAWDGKNTWASINFKTENEVYAAEVDPDRINLLDINFANNSFTVSPQYFVTFSLSLRWLFWVQNMLMILGSAG
ncbi:MAG: hypothetical protein JEY94_02140 [Melioribacteraceae bacterium]|nr:hypothetical protein [Melioribacteraceae bacterium]